MLLRGLPGSGKTRVARALRDAEVDAGAEPPKVHCLDDYFMTEVEKEVVEEELGVSGKTVKRRRKLLTTEYEFEAELEPAYKASLLKGLARTAQEGRFSVVIGAHLRRSGGTGSRTAVYTVRRKGHTCRGGSFVRVGGETDA